MSPTLTKAPRTKHDPTCDFTGQVVLVPGISSGIGLAATRACAEAGAALVLADVNEAALAAATQTLTDRGTWRSVWCAMSPMRLRFQPRSNAPPNSAGSTR